VLYADTRRRTPRMDIAWTANALDHPRFGIIVPRYGQNAVRRNRLRRQVRELTRRKVLPRVQSIDIVIRTRPAAYRVPVAAVASDLERWLGTLPR